jgi:uncharacterized membrane protein
MGIIFLVLVFLLMISGAAGYLIGKKLYRSLVKNANRNAIIWSAITGIASFVFILFGILYLIVTNLSFER